MIGAGIPLAWRLRFALGSLFGESNPLAAPGILRAGERVELAPETKHRDPWNLSGANAVVRAQFEPVPEFIRAYTDGTSAFCSERCASLHKDAA